MAPRDRNGTRPAGAGSRRGDAAFTLIETLLVLIILGILAAIVVFAVGSSRQDSVTSASAADSHTVRTAEEAYFVKFNCYTDQARLVTTGYLKEASTYVSVSLGSGSCPSSYDVVASSPSTTSAPTTTVTTSATSTTTTTAPACSITAAAVSPSRVNRGTGSSLASNVTVSATTTNSCSSVTATFTPSGPQQTVVLTGGPPAWSFTISKSAYNWAPVTYPITVKSGSSSTVVWLQVCGSGC